MLKSEFAAGLFSFIPDETIVDIIGFAGFDFLILDTERGTYDVPTIERLVRAADAAGVASVVRVDPPDPHLIAQVLDTGVDGLVFPNISSRQEAEAVVRSSRLPPLGALDPYRGRRGGHYYLLPDDALKSRLNDVAIVVMIESKEGLDNAEEILSVDGLDGAAVGPVDLARTLGVARDGPEIAAAIEKVTSLARARGKGVMASAKDLDELEGHLKQENGPRAFWYATDTYLIGTHFRGLIEKSREIVKERAGAKR